MWSLGPVISGLEQPAERGYDGERTAPRHAGDLGHVGGAAAHGRAHRVTLGGRPSNGPATARAPGSVLVSLTFDDGFADQQAAVELLAKHELAGTFYVNDGAVGTPAYMTWPQIRALAAAGHEIGGHAPPLDKLAESCRLLRSARSANGPTVVGWRTRR